MPQATLLYEASSKKIGIAEHEGRGPRSKHYMNEKKLKDIKS